MTKRLMATCWVLALGWAIVHPVDARAATLFLDDWGISYGNWSPVSTSSNFTYASVVEDWTGGGGGYLDPGFGGDDYDAEFAAIASDDDYLYLAVVTGFPLEGRWFNGGNFVDHYAAGDIGLDLDSDGSYEYAVDVDQDGKLRSGNLDWENPAINGQPVWDGVSDPLRATSWDSWSSLVDFRYGEFDGRYAIEAIIDLDDLGPSTTYNMHWTMGCGNDEIELRYERPTDPVPEPASLILLGTGLGAAGLFRRRRNRAA